MTESAERGAASPGRDEEAVRRLVERFALDLTEAGMSRMPARVLVAILVAEKGELHAAEIAEFLQVSPAAISGAVRYLTQTALIIREREPGARHDHYRMHDNVWYQSIAHKETLLRQWERTLLDGIEATGTGSRAAARLAESQEFLEFLRLEMPALLEKWRHGRSSASFSRPPGRDTP
ncbi:GbsR/MarR family transcriptional regulator [Streptosporangium roseum]|uniref:GbsR/MarR family transcriptional regulator n=1 Tax=Streptosporangium roseum TaxID=2001 RepID=UPI00332313DC